MKGKRVKKEARGEKIHVPSLSGVKGIPESLAAELPYVLAGDGSI